MLGHAGPMPSKLGGVPHPEQLLHAEQGDQQVIHDVPAAQGSFGQISGWLASGQGPALAVQPQHAPAVSLYCYSPKVIGKKGRNGGDQRLLHRRPAHVGAFLRECLPLDHRPPGHAFVLADVGVA